MIKLVAVLYENDVPIRAWEGNKCIFNAYCWAHKHFCLGDSDPELPLYKLPDWLKITFHIMKENEFANLIK